ncbi:MAG: hypothetical protein ACN4GR_09490 [Arenicellales bacterium]
MRSTSLKAETYGHYQPTSKIPASKRFSIADEKGTEHYKDKQNNWNDLLINIHCTLQT